MLKGRRKYGSQNMHIHMGIYRRTQQQIQKSKNNHMKKPMSKR